MLSERGHRVTSEQELSRVRQNENKTFEIRWKFMAASERTHRKAQINPLPPSYQEE